MGPYAPQSLLQRAEPASPRSLTDKVMLVSSGGGGGGGGGWGGAASAPHVTTRAEALPKISEGLLQRYASRGSGAA
eukprot:54567-Chlamydomonas_euryale.AAC.1